MNQLPETENAIVLRTDFSNDSAWLAVQNAVKQTIVKGITGDAGPVMGLIEFISDASYTGATTEQLVGLTPEDGELTFIIVADSISMSTVDHSVLVIDLAEEPGREFRATPSAIFEIAANLSIANMDFAEFADAVGNDGVFRGF